MVLDLDLPENSHLDKNTTIKKANSKKHIGQFIELCKKGGYIYSGHIHKEEHLISKTETLHF